MAVRTRATGGTYLTTEDHASISVKIHALGHLVIGEQYRHDDLVTTMAAFQGRSANWRGQPPPWLTIGGYEAEHSLPRVCRRLCMFGGRTIKERVRCPLVCVKLMDDAGPSQRPIERGDILGRN